MNQTDFSNLKNSKRWTNKMIPIHEQSLFNFTIKNYNNLHLSINYY